MKKKYLISIVTISTALIIFSGCVPTFQPKTFNDTIKESKLHKSNCKVKPFFGFNSEQYEYYGKCDNNGYATGSGLIKILPKEEGFGLMQTVVISGNKIEIKDEQLVPYNVYQLKSQQLQADQVKGLVSFGKTLQFKMLKASGYKNYQGQFVNGLPNGKGKLYLPGLINYEGNFKDGYMEGFGTSYKLVKDMTFGKRKLEPTKIYGKTEVVPTNFKMGEAIKELEYRGNWKNGKKDGFGIEYFNLADKYIGDFHNNKRDGIGTIISPTKKFEIQKLSSGRISHSTEYKNGWSYSGLFSDGNLILKSSVCEIIQGNKNNSGKTIKYSLSFKDGFTNHNKIFSIYRGYCKNTVPDGYGILSSMDDKNYQSGEWKAGVLSKDEKIDKNKFNTKIANYSINTSNIEFIVGYKDPYEDKDFINKFKGENTFYGKLDKIRSNYIKALNTYDYNAVSQYKDTGIKYLINDEVNIAFNNASTVKQLNTIIKIAENESILFKNTIVKKRKNVITFNNKFFKDKFSNYSSITNPNLIKKYLDDENKLIGVDKSKIDKVMQHCIKLFRKDNNFNGYKNAYSFSKSTNDLNNMDKIAKNSNEKLYVKKVFEYLAINKNKETREKYFKFPKPKKDWKGSDKLDNTYLGNAMIKDFYEMGQGKPVGQFGENIMKALFPTATSSAIVKFNTELGSKATYGTYKVKVKFKLTFERITKSKVMGLRDTRKNLEFYYAEADYIVKPNKYDKKVINFGKVDLTFSRSTTAFVFNFASAVSEAKVKDFDYEIIDIQLID